MPFDDSDPGTTREQAAADERDGDGHMSESAAQPHPHRTDRDEGLAREEMRRLHPYTLMQRFLVSAPALFVILLPALRNPDAGAWVSVGSLALYGVFIIPIFIAQYVRFRYAVTEGEIVIHKGVFTYQHRNIPMERIQNIEIEQSLIPRLFGTARVKIETAGSQSTEGVIEYVSLEEAKRIRSTVRLRQQTTKPGSADEPTVRRGRAVATESAPSAAAERAAAGAPVTARVRAGGSDPAGASTESGEREASEAPGEIIHTMPLGRVLLSGVFRFSLLYIVAIFSATEYLGVTPEDMARWLTGDRFEVVATAFAASTWVVVMATVVMVAVLAWITGIATNLNRFYGFRLSIEDNKLHTRTGLLTVSEGTIPLKKVQALLVRTNPLMSLFGWYRLELQTMGFDPDDRGYRVAVPFARWSDVMEVARMIRPVDEPRDLQPVSRLMIRRTFVRYFVVVSIVAGGVGYFWQPALWGFAVLPLAAALAFLQYRHHGYRLNADYLYVRRGVFRETYWFIPIDRFQVFYLSASLFQRRLGLQTTYVDTPGSGVMMHPEVVDLRSSDASRLLNSLHAQFHERFERIRS